MDGPNHLPSFKARVVEPVVGPSSIVGPNLFPSNGPLGLDQTPITARASALDREGGLPLGLGCLTCSREWIENPHSSW